MNTWEYKLRRGIGTHPETGACAMDAINWLAHGEHGDAPECVDPVLRQLVIYGNDCLSDVKRQRLLPYLPRLSGSNAGGVVMADRIDFLRDAVWRTILPAHYAAIGNTAAVKKLRSFKHRSQAYYWLNPINGGMICALARSILVSLTVPSVGMEVSRLIFFSEAPNDLFFEILDGALKVGPEGEPWSADFVDHGQRLFEAAGGRAEKLVVA